MVHAILVGDELDAVASASGDERGGDVPRELAVVGDLLGTRNGSLARDGDTVGRAAAEEDQGDGAVKAGRLPGDVVGGTSRDGLAEDGLEDWVAAEGGRGGVGRDERGETGREEGETREVGLHCDGRFRF